jgi:predicted MFS family arabinose efflux permease
MAEPRAPVSRPLLLGGLGIAQILGWGSTFYLPAVLGPPMGEALGLRQDIVFGGVTVMYLVGATLAPMLGRMIDARGARPVMAAGSLVGAAALVLLALSQGLVSYVSAWVLIGVMLPMTLGHAGYAAIAQAVPAQSARRAMTLMTLMTGVTSSIAWPATALIEARLGWRGTCLAFAAAHVLLALPLYLAVLPGRPARREAAEGERPRGALALSRWQFLLLVLGLGLPNAITSGLSLIAIALLAGFGHGPAAAIAIAALHGPAQVVARIVDLMLGARSSAMATGLFATMLMPLSLLPLLAGEAPGWASLFTIAFGVSSGLMTVVRAALPLELAGANHYGTLTGRLALPGNVMIAAAPPLFAAVLEAAGPLAAAALAGALSIAALAALAALAISGGDRGSREPTRSGHG